MLVRPWENRCGSGVLLILDDTIANIVAALRIGDLGAKQAEVIPGLQMVNRGLFTDLAPASIFRRQEKSEEKVREFQV